MAVGRVRRVAHPPMAWHDLTFKHGGRSRLARCRCVPTRVVHRSYGYAFGVGRRVRGECVRTFACSFVIPLRGAAWRRGLASRAA